MTQLQAKPALFVDVDGVISLWGFDLNRRPEGRFVNVDGVIHFLSAAAGEHLLDPAPNRAHRKLAAIDAYAAAG